MTTDSLRAMSTETVLHYCCVGIETMTKNVTLKVDENLLKKCRQIAVAKDKSLSQWLMELMARAVDEQTNYARARRRALKRLEKGFRLGGAPLSRKSLHER